jgi:hypothetical protein
LKNQVSPPINIYFLGEQKHLEAREKIVDDRGLMACLDKIVNWNIRASPVLPEILFHFGGSSPTGKMHEKASAKSLTAGSNSSSRSGQSEFHKGVLMRDMKACVFCEATENLTAAHLIAYKDSSDPNLESVFARCKIGTVQDIANGITACGDCHHHFDSHFVGVNPDNMQVEVSWALLYSEDSKVKDKWSKIVGKRLEAKSTMGHWPSVEAFREKYSIFCAGRDKRQANQSELRFQCDECHKGFKKE